MVMCDILQTLGHHALECVLNLMSWYICSQPKAKKKQRQLKSIKLFPPKRLDPLPTCRYPHVVSCHKSFERHGLLSWSSISLYEHSNQDGTLGSSPTHLLCCEIHWQKQHPTPHHREERKREVLLSHCEHSSEAVVTSSRSPPQSSL